MSTAAPGVFSVAALKVWCKVSMLKTITLACALALGLAVVVSGAAQDTILTNGRNLQVPINHGLPDKPLGFTFCRLRYSNIRRARKSGWGDDYPQADYNFLVRLSELTKAPIS